MTAPRLHSLLEEQGISFEVTLHERAFTAKELAADDHVSLVRPAEGEVGTPQD